MQVDSSRSKESKRSELIGEGGGGLCDVNNLIIILTHIVYVML